MNIKKMHLFLLLVLIVVLACCVLFFILRGCEPIVPEDGRLTVDKNAVDIMDGSSHGDAPSAGSISIPGFEKMTIPAGKSNVGCNIYNPEKNSCYFVAVISLDDGREIYRSDLIAPGKAIYSMTLSEPLEDGIYNATLTYYCYATDENQTELNGATTHFILEVTP